MITELMMALAEAEARAKVRIAMEKLIQNMGGQNAQTGQVQ